MAKLETPREISPIQRKGIEMAVRGLHKTFPFIIGYKDDDTDAYDYAHYVNLIVDLRKLSEYTKRDIRPYWKRELMINNNPISYAIWSYLDYEEDLDDISNHPGYQLGKDVAGLLNTIYDYLPEQYVMTYETQYEWKNEPVVHPAHLKVNAYIIRMT